MARPTALLALLCAALLAAATANTFPTDLDGVFSYVDGNKPALCPRTIEHTTFATAGAPGVWVLPHNTIKHDGGRCDSVANERQFTFYRAALANARKVPAELQFLLQTVGQNIDVNFPLNRSLLSAGENYYIGHEAVGRFCRNGASFSSFSKFSNGTVAFLFRPFLTVNMPVNGFKFFRFAPGKKFLVMVPRYEDAICVYDAPIGPADASGTSAAPLVPADPLVASAEPELSAEPSIPPSAPPSPAANPVCFPGAATVRLENGASKLMRDVQIGDVVQTGADTFSRVFMFTHRVPDGQFEFVRIATAAGRPLHLSAGHYLYVNGRLATAGSVRAGDAVDGADGADVVQSVQKVHAEGLYNPQTEDGDIVVDGIRASAYTTAVAPKAAHALLAPLRLAYSFFGMTTAVVEGGADGLAKVAPAGQLIY